MMKSLCVSVRPGYLRKCLVASTIAASLIFEFPLGFAPINFHANSRAAYADVLLASAARPEPRPPIIPILPKPPKPPETKPPQIPPAKTPPPTTPTKPAPDGSAAPQEGNTAASQPSTNSTSTNLPKDSSSQAKKTVEKGLLSVPTTLPDGVSLAAEGALPINLEGFQMTLVQPATASAAGAGAAAAKAPAVQSVPKQPVGANPQPPQSTATK